MSEGLEMLDGKAITGTFLSVGAATASWIDQANAYGQLGLTVAGFLVACLTAWYTWERAQDLRAKRKERDE